jgi:uncharacterized protein DUF5063
MTDLAPDEHFAGLVQEYLELLRLHAQFTVEDFGARAQELLAQLYASALRLPDTHSPDRPCEHSDGRQFTQVFAREFGGRLGGADIYREVFDPYRLDQPEARSSISMGLAEIGRDLVDGLACWDERRVDAVWHWREGFTTRWGSHLPSALRALHVLRYEHGFPAAEPQRRDA